MSLKVLKLGAKWCPPCNALNPVIKRLAEEMKDVEFVSVDIDEEPDLAIKYNVTSVPTLIFIKDGEVVGSMVGLYHENEIRARIEGAK